MICAFDAEISPSSALGACCGSCPAAPPGLLRGAASEGAKDAEQASPARSLLGLQEETIQESSMTHLFACASALCTQGQSAAQAFRWTRLENLPSLIALALHLPGNVPRRVFT